MRAAGLEPDGLVAHAEFGVEGGGSALGELLDRPDPPTAVICSSDMMAIGALHEAARRGLRVPDDLSIVGFDGIDATNWSVPELTTVEQPIAQIADTAVETLADADRAAGTRSCRTRTSAPCARAPRRRSRVRRRSKTSAPSRTTAEPVGASTSSSTTTAPRA